jgi:diguanylate cyclase (GGDEF)-like protein
MKAPKGSFPMPLTAGLPARVAVAVNASGLALVLAVLAQALYDSGLLGGPGLEGLFSGWIYNGTEVGAAALVLARALLVPRERLAWSLLALGIAAFAAGDIYYTVALEGIANVPTPSWSDAGYLTLYPCAFTMIALLVRSHVRHLRTSVWLDGAIGALAIAAVGAALVLDPVIQATHGSFAAVATNLAYPLGDLALIMLVIGVFAVTGWRPGGTWLLIAIGFGLMAVADSIYLFRIAEDTYQAGTLLDAIWPAGLAMLAYAAWAEPREQAEPQFSRFAVMLLPCLFAAVALFLLIRADFVHVGVIPEVLAACALLAAGWRFALTFGDMLTLSELRERQARTDDLTGLPNRREFYAHLNDAIEGCAARAASFALLMIDLDQFKELNDTLGHYAGDLLLQQIGPRMQDVVRGDAVARLGGDEFGLILRDATAAAAAAERIHESLRQPFVLEGVTVSVHASIGIAVFPTDADTTNLLLQRADVAMYHAKEARSRYAFYARGSHNNSRERLGLVSELKDALAQGGLFVHYQPQMRLDNGGVYGVEALVRWQHPQRGLMEAEDFMAIAEQTGVMRELTSLVLEQSLSQQRAWRALGHDLVLAVNISPASLLDSTFLPNLRDQLARWKTPRGSLRLEITESVLIEESSRVRSVIDALGDLGVSLSLDDFGTGYSPLTYLTEVPVSELKIDGSFIAAMIEDRATAIIVENTISLARQLGIALVAEGVETTAQLQLLQSIGCPYAQGYLLSRPMTAQDLERWLTAGGFNVPAPEHPPSSGVPARRAQIESPRLSRAALGPAA